MILKRVAFALALESHSSPSSHQNSCFSNPSFCWKRGCSEGNGKLISGKIILPRKDFRDIISPLSLGGMLIGEKIGAPKFWEWDERRRFQFAWSGGSLNAIGPDLFTELPFLAKALIH